MKEYLQIAKIKENKTLTENQTVLDKARNLHWDGAVWYFPSDIDTKKEVPQGADYSSNLFQLCII